MSCCRHETITACFGSFPDAIHGCLRVFNEVEQLQVKRHNLSKSSLLHHAQELLDLAEQASELSLG